MNELFFTDLDEFKESVEKKLFTSDSLLSFIDDFEEYFSNNNISYDYRTAFYQVIVDKMNSVSDFSFAIEILQKVYSNISNLEILNMEQYLLKMDTMMILGIKYFQNKQLEESKKTIQEAINNKSLLNTSYDKASNIK